MPVLITGGAGYIGSHMCWHLVDQGQQIVVIDRLSTGFSWSLPKNAELIIGDVADQRLVEDTIKRNNVDSIIHFAGSVVVPESVADPLSYYRNNAVASMLLIESAVRCSVRNFIFSSTAAVYGDSALPLVAEDTPLSPQSPYASSKMMTEVMLSHAAAAHNLSYTILRYFNVAGADALLRTGQSTRGATHLIKAAAEAAVGKRTHLYVYGSDYPTRDGTCIRDFIHVSDLVEAHSLALERLRAGAGSVTLNCGYGKGYTVLEVIAAVRRHAQFDFNTVVQGRRQGDIVSVVADTSKIRAELGWKPKKDDLDKIVQDAIGWESKLGTQNHQQ